MAGFQDKMSVTDCFQNYAKIMKASQDKYERLFKIRRDIVIESKRIIFLLLSINGESNKAEVISEADKRLQKIIDVSYAKIGEELINEDPFRYSRVISPGNQEFVEALTSMEFIKNEKIQGPDSCAALPFIPTSDYILGLADMTGELMRQAILGRGNPDQAEKSCQFLRHVYSSMIGAPSFRDLSAKLEVMQTSVCKVERVLYQKHTMGTKAVTYASHGEDEGYQDS